MNEPAWIDSGPQYSDDDRSGEVWITRPVPVTGELIHRLDGVVVLHVEVFFSADGDVQSAEVREVCDDEVWPDDDAVGVDSLTPIETALAWERAEMAL